MAFAQAVEQVEVARAAFAERPVETDADFAQGPRGVGQRGDKGLGRGRGERGVERQREAMRGAQVGEELELVPRGGQQARGVIWPQHAQGMGIERHHDRRRSGSRLLSATARPITA